NEVGKTPLHMAVWKGHCDVVRLLISRGADVNAKDEEGETPLHDATMYGEAGADVVRLLANHGADVNAEDSLGGMPLDYAMFDERMDVIEALLDCGAKADRTRRFDGTTVLHATVSIGMLNVVMEFINRGADVNVRDRDGQSPVHEAAWADDGAMAELLLDHGAKINVKDRNGDTPAHVAAVNGYADLLDLLMSRGANAEAKNDQGLTPLDIARSGASLEMIVLSEPSASPYSVIVTNPRAIRGLARRYGMGFDWAWTPGAPEVERAAAVLKAALEDEKTDRHGGLPCVDRLLADFDRYSKEYGGFTRGQSRYVVCMMHLRGMHDTPPANGFTSIIDGGCSVVCVVIDLTKETVAGVYPNSL
ncbi:MAG: ankyrin repeat domain-containing protein, partial [Solirubrobacterales bacterium]